MELDNLTKVHHSAVDMNVRTQVNPMGHVGIFSAILTPTEVSGHKMCRCQYYSTYVRLKYLFKQQILVNLSLILVAVGSVTVSDIQFSMTLASSI